MIVVTVPEAVKVKIPRLGAGGAVEFPEQEKSIFHFLRGCFESYGVFSKGHVNALIYSKLMTILSESEGKKEIWFEDSDFKSVQAAVAAVEWRTPDMNMAYIPFYEAIAAARVEKTVEPKRQ